MPMIGCGNPRKKLSVAVSQQLLSHNTLSLQANTFQVVIAADQQMTFVFFIYGDIQWGDGAKIHIRDPRFGYRSFMVPGSGTNQVLNIDEGSNVNVTGVYIYRVDLRSVLGPRDGETSKLILVLITFREVCW